MQDSNQSCGGMRWMNLSKFAAVAVFLAAGFPSKSIAQQPGQKTFSSCSDAVSALVTAAENNDEKTILEILGPDGRQIVSSGDPAEDLENRANFVQRYKEMHRFVKEPDGTTTLYAGAHNWPFPIPLMNKAGAWYFDTSMGKKEILFRRIGRNEISTIHVCQELVAAEKEFFASHKKQYAPKIYSDDGKQNGLYWKSGDGQPQSPIGPLVAQAVAHGDAQATPYRGYYFQMLPEQGASAPGGAKSYSADGKMTGFAFVAYPAEYRSSGVMTFIVGSNGVVYSKDLGPSTAAIAKALKTYNPDATWKMDRDQPNLPAAAQNAKPAAQNAK